MLFAESYNMIVRTLKLRPNKEQKKTLEQWLFNLTGVYNWGIRKIELHSKDKIYFSKFDFVNLLANHGKKLEIPSHVIQGTLQQSYMAWDRCFKKTSKKPKLKSVRNKLNSIPFPDSVKQPKGCYIGLPALGKIRFHKQELPEGKIKCGRIVKKASGWHLCLWLDTNHKFKVKTTTEAVGIDPGFSTLLTLSNGVKIENPRELRKGSQRIAQAQRGHDKVLVARLQEKQSNRRNDRNHKISRKLVEDYQTICYSNDNLKGMAKIFGKSISEASLGDLIDKLSYKCRTGGRTLISVKSNFTTMTCSVCGALNGPTGLGGLAVRTWECACGAQHDRDINSAQVILKVGLGTSHEEVA